VKLYMAFDQPVQKDELANFRALIERRVAGEPTAYLLGKREFYGRSFQVDRRVLVPRPETERLVEQVLAALPKDEPQRIVDLCTGSCCIAATLAAERPHWRVLATDISSDALAVAKANVEALGVADRVELRQGDLFAPAADMRFHAVVSNPPYIAAGALPTLPREVQREPHLALLSGPEGMDAITKIATDAPAHLEPNGLLALEIGDDQKALVQDLLNRLAYRDVQVLADWAGKDRVAMARRPA
jgi:release factor glutamine methyltransferase